MEAGQIPRVPVFCDSPMAINAVKIFLKYSSEYSDQARALIEKFGSPLEWAGFTFAVTAPESKKINDIRYPVIIISSSGMVTGRKDPASSRAAIERPKEHGSLHRISGAGHEGRDDQERRERSEDFRRFRADSRSNRRVRTIQRPC